MRLGSLFSGAGIGDLGWLMAGFDIRWQVEIDPYCQKILQLRYPESKKYDDIRKIKGEELETVEVVAGGFPCQPFSVAGKQRGKQDDRNLWPEMLRIVKSIRPAWVVAENVPGLINLYLDHVLSDLEAEGYTTRTIVFSAHSLGAWHKRERIWVMAHAGLQRSKEHEEQTTRIEQSSTHVPNSTNFRQPSDTDGEPDILYEQGRELSKDKQTGDRGECGIEGGCKIVADSNAERSQRSRSNKYSQRWKGQNERPPRLCSIFKKWWSTEPSVGRVVAGCPDRIHRLKAIGNSQVPACTAFIGEQIMEIERRRDQDAQNIKE